MGLTTLIFSNAIPLAAIFLAVRSKVKMNTENEKQWEAKKIIPRLSSVFLPSYTADRSTKQNMRCFWLNSQDSNFSSIWQNCFASRKVGICFNFVTNIHGVFRGSRFPVFLKMKNIILFSFVVVEFADSNAINICCALFLKIYLK